MLIFGEINLQTAEAVLRELRSGTLHEIVVCSNGGDLVAATSIYDAIIGKNIKVIGTGIVASAGIFILLGGSQRLATQQTRFMTHPVSIEGTEEQADKDELDLCQKTCSALIAARTGLSIDTAIDLMGSTHYFGVQEAKTMGFIHEVYQ